MVTEIKRIKAQLKKDGKFTEQEIYSGTTDFFSSWVCSRCSILFKKKEICHKRL